jgi:hypothetical protein
MKYYTFTIEGNQKDPQGNPIPYKRTLAGKFRKDSIDYMEWKEFVRSEFDRKGVPRPVSSTKSFPYPELCDQHEVAVLTLNIGWRDRKGGDCDNIFKGIADALFENDKCIVEGHFYSRYTEEKAGNVVVGIEIYTAEEYKKKNGAKLEGVS